MDRKFLSMRKVELTKYLLPASLLGISLGGFIHGYWLTDIFPVGSKSLLFFTLLIGLIGILGYILLFQWITDALHNLSIMQKAGILGTSLLAGAFLFFTVTDHWQEPARYIGIFLPRHTLEIKIPPEQNNDRISILWVNTSLGDVSYDALEYDGWEVKNDRLLLTDLTDNHLRWVGKTGGDVQIVFETPSQNGTAVISWDGREDALQFSRKKNSYEHTFEVPFYASRELILLLGILNFAFLSSPLCFLVWKKRLEMLRSIQDSFVPDSKRMNVREWTVTLALIALVLVLRAPNLESLFPSVEEYSQINAAKQIIQGVPIASVYQRSLWLVTLPVSLMFRVFGYELWAARLLGVIFNALAVIPLYLVTRKINRPIAILSILLFATSPWVIAMSRVVREYAYYPFYYFWIIYGMILLLEQVPDRFRVDRDWRVVLRPRILFLGLGLVLPPFYALYVDNLSTFKLILIAYAALALFMFSKVDLRYGKNLVVVLVMISVILVGAYLLYLQYSTPMTVNLVPLNYFFLNSPQQWYFDRAAIIPLTGFLGTVVVGVLLRRTNTIPLFLLALYGGFLGFFVFFSNRFFAPRHLSTAQLWYVILMAIGLYLLWVFLKTFSFLKEKRTAIVTAVILAGVVINFQQILVPLTSRDPYMPITGDYHNDLTDLHAFMLANVRNGDVLISSRIYSRYVEWMNEPDFQKVYDFQVQTTENDVLSIVDQNDSGWIIIDNARIERAVFSPDEAFRGNDRIEYIGLFDDENVWRWGVK